MAKPKQSLILVPFPYQGHITPMLQLGAILHSQGFSVIVAHPDFSSLNPLDHPEFVFVPLSADFSGIDTSSENAGINIISAINRSCRIGLQDFLAPAMKDGGEYGKICCIIYDVVMSFGSAVAEHLKIPSLVLSTYNAVYMQVQHALLQLHAQNQIPMPESRLLDRIPQLHALRYKDMCIPINATIDDRLVEFLRDVTNLRSSVGVIWNSSDVLDGVARSELGKHYKLPFFPIGPFHKVAAATSSATTSFIKEDRSCIGWLDKQSANSVLYISLGSSTRIKPEELEETAWGLAGSGLPFLWVIRPGSVAGTELLPKGFLQAVGVRGCIVKWAPQKEVLAHASVGGFLSHCGWNSTLESIAEGVPMICRPSFGDQGVNARYITHVWNVGLELEEVEDRGVIERTVKRIMVEDEGKDIRERMLALKKRLDDSFRRGGSSYQSLNGLTDYISSF